MSASRLDDLRMVDPVLTTIAQGYSNNALVWDKLFPTVAVEKHKGKIPVFGRDSFIIRETDRAIRSTSNRIPPSDLSFIEFETQERDIEIAIDYLEEEEAADFYRYEQRVTRELSDILALGKEKAAAELAQDPTNYDSSQKLVLTASDAWNDYTLTDVDPIEHIKAGMAAIRGRIAVYPNTMVIGESAWKSLLDHPKIIERVQYSGLAAASRDIISRLCGIDDIYVGMSVHSADGSEFTDIWTDNVVLAFVDKAQAGKRSEYNPSFGYTMQRKGNPEIDTYYENGGKIKVIRNTDNYSIKVTSTDAAFLITDTNH